MHHTPGAIKKEHINGKGHSKSVNRVFAAQQQSFAGLQGWASQQAAQARPPRGGDLAANHQRQVARAIVGAQLSGCQSHHP